MFHSKSQMMTMVLRIPRSYTYTGLQLRISAVGKIMDVFWIDLEDRVQYYCTSRHTKTQKILSIAVT